MIKVIHRKLKRPSPSFGDVALSFARNSSSASSSTFTSDKNAAQSADPTAVAITLRMRNSESSYARRNGRPSRLSVAGAAGLRSLSLGSSFGASCAGAPSRSAFTIRPFGRNLLPSPDQPRCWQSAAPKDAKIRSPCSSVFAEVWFFERVDSPPPDASARQLSAQSRPSVRVQLLTTGAHHSPALLLRQHPDHRNNAPLSPIAPTSWLKTLPQPPQPPWSPYRSLSPPAHRRI